MSAVILAAGMGSRLREIHDRPKGFLKFGDKPIIEESLNRLIQSGIERICIVTGYRSSFYEVLAKKYEGVTTIFNPFYSS